MSLTDEFDPHQIYPHQYNAAADPADAQGVRGRRSIPAGVMAVIPRGRSAALTFGLAVGLADLLMVWLGQAHRMGEVPASVHGVLLAVSATLISAALVSHWHGEASAKYVARLVVEINALSGQVRAVEEQGAARAAELRRIQIHLTDAIEKLSNQVRSTESAILDGQKALGLRMEAMVDEVRKEHIKELHELRAFVIARRDPALDKFEVLLGRLTHRVDVTDAKASEARAEVDEASGRIDVLETRLRSPGEGPLSGSSH